MSIINSQPLIGASGQGGGYNLTKSLRFRSSVSGYLNRTFSTPTNALKWTWSGWVKRGVLGTNGTLISGITSGSIYTELRFNSTDVLRFHQEDGATTVSGFNTTAVYRDPSAWYHIVCIYDSANATSANRLLIYVNGVLQSGSFDVSVPLNQASNINKASEATQIGNNTAGPIPFDGYMAEVNFIDGQALTPSSFGETSTSTGVWIPKKYTGTYGTNGFYLPFTDVATTSGSNAGLGKDFSGNGNYWTTNNISVTSGSTYDSMKDVPTLTDTDTANYAVMNPLTTGSLTTLSGANLNLVQTSGSSSSNSRSSFAMLTGKWYFETTLTANSSGIYPQLGIMTARDGSRPNNDYPQAGYSTSSLDPTLSVIYMADGTKQTNGSASSYGSSFTNGDVIGIAIDSDNGAIYFGKQTGGTGSMVWQNSGVPTSGSSKTGAALTWTGGTVEHVYSVCGYNNLSQSVNFGQRPFSATPPTGFKALNTFNLPTPTIGATASTTANKYMDATLYTGTGTTAQNIVNAGSFQPDFVWIKSRSNAYYNELFDVIRGVNKPLFSNDTLAEANRTGMTAFNSNGFTVQDNGTTNQGTNAPSATFVGWQWKANGSGSTNTAGSITSTVSANTTAGFSIVTFTSPSSGTATVGHGLGVAPSLIITKSRSSVGGWPVYHASIGNTNYLDLQTTAASVSTTFWNNTSPTSSVFTIGSPFAGSLNLLAYCFAQVAGYSAFGSYTGNGSADGVFVYTGFRPRFILIKGTGSSRGWEIHDTSRDTYNQAINILSPNVSDAEYSSSSYAIDFVSNGFKLRNTNTYWNGSGETYIYACFAENPFKFSNAR